MGLGVTLVLQAALMATSGETYSEAHKATTEKGCPLVVVVGATWCPACQQLKDKVLPEVKRHGVLRNVAFANVDLDEEHELGAQLTNGGPIPQIVVYRKTPVGWLLRRLVGGHDVKSVEDFISQGVSDSKNKSQTGTEETVTEKDMKAKDSNKKASKTPAKVASETRVSSSAN
jgi:thioredoxin-like negative regulator of GroEL